MTASPNEVKTTYVLEMKSRDAFRPKLGPSELDIRRVEIPCPELNWFLHQAVGVDYRWGGRDGWDRDTWKRYVDRPEVQTWVAYISGTPAGYFELVKQPDASVRIECLGLRPGFIGRGLGGHLLTACVERAWDMAAQRVWLTTCSHDHEHALNNYMARGFTRISKTVGPPNRQYESALFRE